MALAAFYLPEIPPQRKNRWRSRRKAPRRVSPVTYVPGLPGFCGRLFPNVIGLSSA